MAALGLDPGDKNLLCCANSTAVLFETDDACTGSRLDGVDAAADHLSHVIALEPRFWPALVEKARLWAAVGDWEQVHTVVEKTVL